MDINVKKENNEESTVKNLNTSEKNMVDVSYVKKEVEEVLIKEEYVSEDEMQNIKCANEKVNFCVQRVNNDPKIKNELHCTEKEINEVLIKEDSNILKNGIQETKYKDATGDFHMKKEINEEFIIKEESIRHDDEMQQDEYDSGNDVTTKTGMSSAGRKKDIIWTFFDQIKEENKAVRAKCKKCEVNMVGLVARMRKHIQKCVSSGSFKLFNEVSSDESDGNMPFAEIRDKCKKRKTNEGVASTSSDISTWTTRSKSNVESFIVRSKLSQSAKLDNQIARYIYATNTSFRAVEHKEFKALMNMLRPEYEPPSRHEVSNRLLDEVFDSVQSRIKENLTNKNVCLAIDGWSNVLDDPIVTVCVIDIESESVHLIESIDTSGNSYTSEYILELLKKSIRKCHEKYRCNVTSVVIDIPANIVNIKNDLSEELDKKNIINYNSLAQILNLLAHDLEEYPEVKSNIKKICKYFRNVNFANAKYRETGGSVLILPQDVYWNTLVDCLESYLKNWPILRTVCSNNKVVLDKDIIKLVNDMDLKAHAHRYLKKMKYIVVALDKAQRSSCTLGEAPEILIDLVKSFQMEESKVELNHSDVQKVKYCLDTALSPVHYCANLLDHRFRGENLNQAKLDSAMEYVEQYHPEAMPTVINFRAQCPPFKPYMFCKQLVENVKPFIWWRSIKNLDSTTTQLMQQLHTAVASSANIERLFSSYGLNHSNLTNRLGNEKAAKLVSIFKALNGNPTICNKAYYAA